MTLSPEARLKKRGFDSWKHTSFLTMDPGTKNWWIAWFANGRLAGTHHMQATFDSLPAGDASRQFGPFEAEYKKILKATKPTYVLAERFASRQFGSSSTELISLMLGHVYGLNRRKGIITDFVMASTWKNDFNRNLGDYKALVTSKKSKSTQQHVIDTVCTARYVLSGFRYEPKDLKWIEQQLSKARPIL